MSTDRSASLRRALGLRIVVGGGLLLVLLFLALDFMIDREIYDRFDEALVARGHLLATEITGSVPAGRRMPDGWPEFRRGQHTDFFQLWDDAGRTLSRSPSSGPLDLARPPSPPGAIPVLYNLTLPDGHHGRAAALRLGDDAMVFAIASEREALDALERHIHLALVITIGAVLVLMVSLALMAVRRALQPLADFGADAERRAREPSTVPYDLRALPQELQPVASALDRAFTRITRMLLRERRFARDLAHELRTPLAEMFALIETLPATTAHEDGRAQLAQTLTGMTRIVDGLLALARYEAGMDEPAIEPLDLVSIVRAQVQAQSADAMRRGLGFDLTLPAELWVMGDELLIERIVSNLLRNAVSHAPEGDRLGVHRVASAAGLSLCFENAAPTLTTSDLPRLGERHFRVGEASASGGHAGLGLALCTALAEQLELTIAYTLEQGRLTVELAGFRALDSEL